MHRLEFTEECMLDPSLTRFLVNRKEGPGAALKTSYVTPSGYEIHQTVLIFFRHKIKKEETGTRVIEECLSCQQKTSG